MSVPRPILQTCLAIPRRLVTLCDRQVRRSPSARRWNKLGFGALGRSPPRKLLGVVLGSWLACVALTVRAQGNDLGSPAGGRSTLMGNTGVALGRDGASPFNNPATIVRILDQRLAFSVNFYSLDFLHFDNWHQPGDVDAQQFGPSSLGGTGLFDTNFESLPSTLCLFFSLEQVVKSLAFSPSTERAPLPARESPIGKKLAVCFATLESEDVDMQAIAFRGATSAGPTTQVQSLQRRWVRTYIGPTYSVSLSDRFAIGGSIHVVYTRGRFGVNSLSLSSRLGGDGVGSTLGTSGRGRSFELTGLLGVTYRVGRVTLGASVRLPALHLFGSYDATFNQTQFGSEDRALVADASGRLSTAPPTRLALGVGVTGKRWRFELDAALGLPLQKPFSADITVVDTTLTATGTEIERSRAHYRIPGYVTLNPSLGVEYFANAGLSLLGGISTNFTALGELRPMPSVGNVIQARMSHVNASIGIGTYWDKGEFLFGLQFDYGWGSALAINPYVIPNAWTVVGAQTYGILFVVAGSTSFDAIVRVVDRIANGAGPHEKRQVAADGTLSSAPTEQHKP